MNKGEEETRKSLAEGHGITFPNADEAIKWLKSSEENRLLDKELREKLDKEIDYLAKKRVVSISGALSTPYEYCAVERYRRELELFSSKIIAFIKEAGKEAGYVKLGADQGLPLITLEEAEKHDASEPWCAGNFTDSLQEFGKKAQRDMIKLGWRKVILDGD